MKKNKNQLEYEYKTLDPTLEWLLLHDYVNDVDSQLKEATKSKIKEILRDSLAIGSLILAFAIPSVAMKIIFLLLSLGTTIHNIRYEMMLSEATPKEVEEFNTEKEIESFRTKEFKEFIEEKKTEEKIKYDNALKNQKEKTTTHIHLVENEQYFSKEEVHNFMVSMIELYYELYKLPPYEIESTEWNTYYDSLYEELEKINREKEYYDICYMNLMYTLSISMIKKQDQLKIEDFVDSLKFLNYKYNTFIPGFSDKQILTMKKNIVCRLIKDRSKNIIKFRKTID